MSVSPTMTAEERTAYLLARWGKVLKRLDAPTPNAVLAREWEKAARWLRDELTAETARRTVAERAVTAARELLWHVCLPDVDVATIYRADVRELVEAIAACGQHNCERQKRDRTMTTESLMRALEKWFAARESYHATGGHRHMPDPEEHEDTTAARNRHAKARVEAMRALHAWREGTT